MASVSLDTTWEYTDMEEIDLPEIDGALLTALLEEEPPAEKPQEEHLAYVLRSLEAEIGLGSTATSSTSDGESMDGEMLLDDMLSDAYSACSTLAGMLDVDPFGWPEADAVPASPADEIGEWYLNSGEMGLMGYHPGSLYCDDVPVEEVCGPLWQ